MEHPLDEMAQRIFHANKKQGFWPETIMFETSIGQPIAIQTDDFALMQLLKSQKICLIHTELSEALEGLRKQKESDKIPGFTAEEEELADALIRILDHCAGFKLRLGAAFEAKLAYNAARPYMHGKKF